VGSIPASRATPHISPPYRPAITWIASAANCLIFPTVHPGNDRIPWTNSRVSGLMIDVLTESNAIFETKIPVRTIEHATKLAF
jgi:hypothetical protein